MNTPPDQIAELRHAILFRKGYRTLKANVEQGEATGRLFDRARQIFDTTTG